MDSRRRDDLCLGLAAHWCTPNRIQCNQQGSRQQPDRLAAAVAVEDRRASTLRSPIISAGKVAQLMSQNRIPRLGAALALVCIFASWPAVTHAAASHAPSLLGIPIEFLLFALVLAGVALLHHHTLRIALIGLGVIAAYKLMITGFKSGTGLPGLAGHLQHEWVTLTNLLLLLLGFALLSRHFEKSRVPFMLPRFLPDGWKGGFVLLAMIFVLSSFLDNIAAALIGGAMAHQLFRAKVHIGYLAAIVAASNAGGAGSVIGDTTTTMMWVAGVSPTVVFECIVAAIVALFIFGIPAAIQQQRYSPLIQHPHRHAHVDLRRIGIVALTLIFAIAANVVVNIQFPQQADHFPFV